MKILIIGLGSVGMAYAKAYRHKIDELGLNVVIHGYDTNEDLVKNLSLTHDHILDHVSGDPESFNEVDCILYCAMTPTTPDRILVNGISEVINKFTLSEGGVVIMKSTMPIGGTEQIQAETDKPLVYIPEFLREGKTAVEDILFQDTIFIGRTGKNKRSYNVHTCYIDILYGKNGENVKCITSLSSNEVEFVKLMKNAYKAKRAIFFNDMNTIAIDKGIDPTVVKIVCESDDFIGNTYNTPSFGVGGPYLMKDSRELFSKDSRSILLDSDNRRTSLFHAERIYNLYRRMQVVFPDCRLIFNGLGFKKDHSSTTDSSSLFILLSIQSASDNDKQHTNIGYIHDNEVIISNSEYTSVERIVYDDIKDTDVVVNEFIHKVFTPSVMVKKFVCYSPDKIYNIDILEKAEGGNKMCNCEGTCDVCGCETEEKENADRDESEVKEG